ncbi:MAG: diacylglycerol kinase family protein [Planctomycetota bacterium]|nr:MAG: diacylglycerol kinase family protein [Planctomycetota bacterium]
MRHWIDKFCNAFRGVGLGVHGQSSFIVHALAVVGVIVAAILLRCDVWQWSVLLLCMALVLGFEMFNSALERLAQGLCREHNPQVGQALDIASAAVLVAALFAAAIGILVLVSQWVAVMR